MYENQFYFLTNNAVLSLSHGGNFYVEHGLKDPKLFSLANDKSLIVLNNESLVYLSKIKPYKKILKLDENPLSLIYDNKSSKYETKFKNSLSIVDYIVLSPGINIKKTKLKFDLKRVK